MRNMASCWLGLLAVVLLLIVAGGCKPPAPPAAPAAGGQGHDHGHGHSHSHGHGHEDSGPHGGHLVELGDEQYHIEWLHDDDSGLVTLYVLDAQAENEVPIKAASIAIEVQVGDEQRSHELAAVEPGEAGTARFELVDAPLVEVLKAAGQEGVAATVTVEIEGQSFTGTFEHHDHAH